jgi:regulator of sirC expression with transglutaminase-like and TPR domain
VSATQLYVDALRKLRDGDVAQADALLTRAIALGDAPHESWYERALLRAARDEMAAATEDLRAYLERAPNGKRSAEARDLLRSWQ